MKHIMTELARAFNKPDNAISQCVYVLPKNKNFIYHKLIRQNLIRYIAKISMEDCRKAIRAGHPNDFGHLTKLSIPFASSANQENSVAAGRAVRIRNHTLFSENRKRCWQNVAPYMLLTQ